jgi:putative acetyltransferase
LGAARLFVQIRRFRDSDTEALIALFERSVLELGPKKYSAEAVGEWAGGVKDVERWRQRMRRSETFVAEDENGTLLGWIEFERDGHLDMLYCSPEAAGTGRSATTLRCSRETRMRDEHRTILCGSITLFGIVLFKKRLDDGFSGNPFTPRRRNSACAHVEVPSRLGVIET